MMQDEVASNAQGLLRCLQALSDEADTLALHRTLIAIRNAVDICQQEISGLRLACDCNPLLSLLH